MHKYGELYCINTKKSCEIMFNDLLKNDSKSSLSKNFFEFFRTYENFITKYRSSLTKMEKELLEPINLFSKHLNGKYNDSLNEYKALAYSTYEGKKCLEKLKHKYFDSCKLAVEQEKILMKVMNDLEKNLTTDLELEHAHDILIKLRLQAENNCQNYKIELNKTNKLFEENEKKYFPWVERVKLIEESRINFIKFHFEKFMHIQEEFKLCVNELHNRMNNSIAEVKVEVDMKYFCEKLNYLYKNNERFPKEEFLNYEIYRRNLEKMLSNSQIPLNTANVNVIQNSSDEYMSTSNSEKNDVYSDDDEENINIIKNFYQVIKSSDMEISTSEFTKLLENLQNNIQYSKKFIDKLLVHYKQRLFVQIYNYQNLLHFANILVTITNNTEIEKDLFDMNFAIIYIAEKTFYVNPENKFNKIYLCKILSKNKIYGDKRFWMDLIGIKINSLIDQKISIEIQKREKENSNNSYSNVNESQHSNQQRGIFSIGSRVKNLFTSSMVKENKKIESSMIHTNIYEQIKSNEAAIVIREYILHFANFSFDVSEAIDIIVDLCQNYNNDKEKVSFFISLLNSNLFSIKNKPMSKFIHNDLNHFYMNKEFKNYINLNDSNMIIIAFSMKYVEIKEYQNLLCINKNFSKKLSKIIFKNVLFKYHNMDNHTRFEIWRNLLSVHKLKRSVNYKELLEEVDLKIDSSIVETISLDVNRTSFDDNALLNILKAVAYKKPNINYCQGMNYIAAFLYQLTANEEETFYLMYGLLESTEYGNIFLHDLTKLKQFFYVFERLIYIYLPELHIYFKNNSISVSYFISPWFITIFTNSYQHINSNSTYPKILIRIWDQFLLNGWKAIIKSGLSLIKHYENHLLELKYEELLHFLINDIIKCEFFQNNNYDYYIDLTRNVKLPSGLVSNLENEYMLDIKVKEVDEKKKENLRKISYEKENSIKI